MPLATLYPALLSRAPELGEIAAGLRQSLQPQWIAACWRSSEKFRACYESTLMLNLLLGLGSWLLYELGLLPGLQLLHALIVPSGYASGLELFHGVLALGFRLLWLWPLYALTFVLNTAWYQDLAKEALQSRARLTHTALSLRNVNFLGLLAGELYRLVLGVVYLLQALLLARLPFVGRLLAFASMTWLYALYSFEYNWVLSGVLFSRRMDYFAQHYLYFFGFGLPFATAMSLLADPWRDAFFAVCFPILVVNATFAVLPRERASPLLAPRKFQPFRLSYAWTSVCFRYVFGPLYALIQRALRRWDPASAGVRAESFPASIASTTR